MNEIRKDYFLDRWTIIAANRAKRPDKFKRKPDKQKKGICFFCPGNEGMTPPEICRVEGKNGWIIRVFPNKFPATTKGKGKKGKDLIPAYGEHEIIVETPKHKGNMHDLDEDHLFKVFEVYEERIKVLQKDKKIKYVSVFKNRGKTAGASLPHTHTQIIGLPFVPTLVKEESVSGKCPYCKIVKKEEKGPRKILSDGNVVAFTPYASRFPFEAWIFPKRHVRTFSELNPEEKLSFVKALKEVLTKLDHGLDFAPYNFYLHYSPKGKDLHFHLELCPKMSILAGFELSSGMYINTMSPENAAKFYRSEQ